MVYILFCNVLYLVMSVWTAKHNKTMFLFSGEQQKVAEKNIVELQNRLSSQNLQLSIREQENSSLNGTIERLQKEKLQLQTELARMSIAESSTKSGQYSNRLKLWAVKTISEQGSHTSWKSGKTWKMGLHFSTQGKVREFRIRWDVVTFIVSMLSDQTIPLTGNFVSCGELLL